MDGCRDTDLPRSIESALADLELASVKRAEAEKLQTAAIERLNALLPVSGITIPA